MNLISMLSRNEVVKVKTPKIETERLVLREIHGDDVDDIYNCWMQDEDVLLNCVNSAAITHKRAVILTQGIGLRFFCYFTPYC